MRGQGFVQRGRSSEEYLISRQSLESNLEEFECEGNQLQAPTLTE